MIIKNVLIPRLSSMSRFIHILNKSTLRKGQDVGGGAEPEKTK